MSKKIYYVEPNNRGGFSVTQANAQRALLTAGTQAQAIEQARSRVENAVLHVARVRHLNGKPHPDKFRKIHV